MHILLRLARYGLQYKRYLILAWISLLGSSVLALAVLWLIGTAVDLALTDGDKKDLLLLAGFLLFLSLIHTCYS